MHTCLRKIFEDILTPSNINCLLSILFKLLNIILVNFMKLIDYFNTYFLISSYHISFPITFLVG